MTRALIAEDEPLLAASLQALLAEAWPELEVVAVAPNGPAALEACERERPEVAFLDIRMPGLTGLEVAEELADRMGERVPAIVFVTAYDEYALAAFDAAAVDYVLKPVNTPRLARAVERLKARLAKPEAGLDALLAQLRGLAGGTPSPTETLRTIRAGVGNSVKMIPVDDVLCFQAADKYTSVITAEGEALIRTPLKELLAQLPADRFKQVHRGTIVNLQAVVAAMRDEQGKVSLRLRGRDEPLAVSRIYADLFRAM